ncbi:MAG: S8 family serine peptidase, partial [Propionibacteriaceae bacterium]|nr:S8 family serine peptidase [Propionibacteriaceae bacterium]
LSLGSAFGATDDPEVAVVNNLAKHGVLPVFSSGNSGDVTDVGGAPGNAARALTVASSVDAANALDGLSVDSPADVAGTVAGQMSVAYPWATSEPVSGTVVKLSDPDNSDGCSALSSADAAAVAGKVAWLVWDDNDATRECGSVARSANVVAAGAIGALFTSTLTEFSAGITGSGTIPVFQLNGPATEKLDAAATAGTLEVTFDGSLATSEPLSTPSRVDTLSDFSSRGARGLPGVVKPDVTAPGETIISAGVGTGNGRANYSGTSMAAPHISGIAALVKKQHPGWTVEQLKAAIMNTAVHDLYTGENSTGKRYGPNRVGAGRTDARYAVSTDVLAYSRSDRGVVSASFGVVEAPITSSKITRTKKITVVNKGKHTRSISLSYSAVISQPGVSYSVNPSRITLRRGQSRTVTVTMTIRPRSLRHTLDPTMSDMTSDSLVGDGYREFVSDASGRLLVKPSGRTALRVPVYGAAKPVSKTTVVATTNTGGSVLKVTGNGFDQGSGSSALTSIGSAMELGASSRKLPTCAARQTSNCVLNDTARSLDLQYTGLGVMPAEDMGWFGFSTWGNWSSMAVSGEVDVAVDTDNDGEANYWVVYYPGSADQPLSLIFDAGGPFDAYSVNFLDGRTDTNVFDSNTAVLPFPLSDLGVSDTDTSFPIKYRVETYSYYGDPNNGSLVDATDWVSTDLLQPKLTVSEPIFPDVAGYTLDYSVATASAGATSTGTGTDTTVSRRDSTPVQALVLHLHGRSG